MGGKAVENLRQRLTTIPLFGPLFACKIDDYAAATREFIIIIAFASSTFWVSALLLKIFDSENVLTLSAILDLTISEGQLFIFATALLGPILVFATEDPPNARPFPARTWIIFTLVVLAIVCSVCYAITKGAGALNPIAPVPLNQSLLTSVALVCALIAASFRYMAILYNKYRMRPEEVKASEAIFAQEFAQRHRIDTPIRSKELP